MNAGFEFIYLLFSYPSLVLADKDHQEEIFYDLKIALYPAFAAPDSNTAITFIRRIQSSTNPTRYVN